MKQPAVYVMASGKNGTLYTGVTSNIFQRVYQHKQEASAGFTKKYHCKMLVYYEYFEDMPTAIFREKQIKAGSRKQKLRLIEGMNPKWADLYEIMIS